MADVLTPLYSLTEPTPGGDSNLWGQLLNTNFATLDSIIGLPRIVRYTPTISGSTVTLDLALGTVALYTVVGATTFAFANVPTGVFSSQVLLALTNGGAGVLTWPGSVAWLGGIAPTLQVSGVDLLLFRTVDNGTTWYGERVAAGARQRVLHQTAGLTTTSGTEVSIDSYSLPGNALAAAGQAIRITIGGVGPAGGATIKIIFGGFTVESKTLGAGESFFCSMVLGRVDGTNQRVIGTTFRSISGTTIIGGGPTETLSGAVLVDIRGNATVGGQTLFVYATEIEFLSA